MANAAGRSTWPLDMREASSSVPTVRRWIRVLAAILAMFSAYVSYSIFAAMWTYGFPTVEPFAFLGIAVTSAALAAVVAFIAFTGREPKWLRPRGRGTHV